MEENRSNLVGNTSMLTSALLLGLDRVVRTVQGGPAAAALSLLSLFSQIKGMLLLMKGESEQGGGWRTGGGWRRTHQWSFNEWE